MSGGIDTGYGDHIGDGNEMVERGLEEIHRLRESNCLAIYRFWEGVGVVLAATDDAADQPDEERSVRG